MTTFKGATPFRIFEMASPAAPPPPPPDQGRKAPATGRPDSDLDQNHDVQQGGRRRRRKSNNSEE